MKLLVVDDEELMREMITDVILSEKFCTADEVVKAINGVDGLDKFKKFSPDIVITDMMMPEMDGAQLIQNIRELNSECDIMIVTGYADFEMASSVLKHNVFDILRKPFHPEEICLALRKLIEKRDLKTQNQEFEKRLVQSEKLSSLGLLSAGIAHEINNPTAFIKGNLELMQRYFEIMEPKIKELAETEGENQKKYKMIYETCPRTLTSALEGTERIKKIVSGLSSFSRKSSSNREPCSVLGMVEQAMTLTNHKIKNHNLECTISEDTPKVHVNSQDMVQVFMNLLVNSVDAIEENSGGDSKKGNLKISVDKDDASNTLSIIFSDDGCGMSEETIQKIYDPFFTTKDVGKGTGLGMSVVRGNIENNGGKLDCSSEVGKGTTFTITVPFIT